MPGCRSPFSRRAILPGKAVSRRAVSGRVIHRIGRSSAYRAAFHAITTGTNTVRFPRETITGHQAVRLEPGNRLGKPQVLIPLLVRYGS
jgi:hypothetical protein